MGILSRDHGSNWLSISAHARAPRRRDFKLDRRMELVGSASAGCNPDSTHVFTSASVHLCRVVTKIRGSVAGSSSSSSSPPSGSALSESFSPSFSGLWSSSNSSVSGSKRASSGVTSPAAESSSISSGSAVLPLGRARNLSGFDPRCSSHRILARSLSIEEGSLSESGLYLEHRSFKCLYISGAGASAGKPSSVVSY